jgi:plasmid stability protein
MKHKLTLYVDDKLIERAKVHAILHKRSVSEIVEELLRGYLDGLEKRKGKS